MLEERNRNFTYCLHYVRNETGTSRVGRVTDSKGAIDIQNGGGTTI